MTMQKLKQQLKNLKQNEPLKNHTSFKIGGPAKWFYEAKNIADFVKAVKLARELKLNYFILGGGTNILINDKGIDGLVIKNNCQKIEISDSKVYVESGARLAKLTDDIINAGLKGLEQIGNIPGTVGGAIWGNAGAYGIAIGDFLVKAKILTPDNQIKEIDKDYFQFKYRDSILKHNSDILLSAELEFREKDEILELKKIRQEEQADRIKKQPQGVGTAGCFFKNLIVELSQIKDNQLLLNHFNERKQTDLAAGFLIDQAGLKGYKVGDAMVSDVHTNFIVNTGNTTASDVLELVKYIKNEVYKKFGLKLEHEVYFINQQGRKEQL
ncbi:UDP-N-acetylmuramate dehydrogenase [Patescibacteria group bacterium]